MDLSTKYLGFTLNNPIVVASCGLTKTSDQIKKCEQAGAGAVVMKSVFEEQIQQANSGIADSAAMHPEALEYLRAEIDKQYGTMEYLETIKQAKSSVSIPIIASVNCHSSKWWTTYAKQIEAAGADALELNIYVFPYDPGKNCSNLEDSYIEILQKVKENIRIPVAIKLSPHFTSFANFAEKLDNSGADGLVLFNRFINTDIDINKMTSLAKPSFNDPVGFFNTLRWTALLSGMLNIDIAASGGIKDSKDVIKQLLAGASAVQAASVFYRDGVEKIGDLLSGLENWMKEKAYNSINDFKGKMNQQNNPQNETYVRAQYLKTYAGIE